MTKIWDRAAMRVASARYLDRQGMLDVTFENGDHFLVAVESLLSSESYAPFSGPGPRAASRAEHSRSRIGPKCGSARRVTCSKRRSATP